MSASREKKTRQERGADYVSPKQQKELEAQKANRRSTLAFTAGVVLFVLFFAAVLIWNSGTIQRGAAAVRINGETYTAADVSYYYKNARTTFFNSLGGTDPGGSLRKSEYEEGKSWFSLIIDSALKNMTSTVYAAQAGKAAGLDLTEDYQNEVNESLSTLKSTAEQNGYTFSQYLKGVFGSMMTKEIYERNVRTAILAQAYSDSISVPSAYTEAELTAKRDAEPEKYDTVSVRHILVDDEETAKSILSQWESGEKTEDSFAALVKDNSTDTGSVDNGGLYEDFTAGTMVTEFNDWCFDNARKPGDTGIVQTQFGYHVMYFVRRGIPANWQETAAQALGSEKLAALTEGIEAEQLSGIKYVDR